MPRRAAGPADRRQTNCEAWSGACGRGQPRHAGHPASSRNGQPSRPSSAPFIRWQDPDLIAPRGKTALGNPGSHTGRIPPRRKYGVLCACSLRGRAPRLCHRRPAVSLGQTLPQSGTRWCPPARNFTGQGSPGGVRSCDKEQHATVGLPTDGRRAVPCSVPRCSREGCQDAAWASFR